MSNKFPILLLLLSLFGCNTAKSSSNSSAVPQDSTNKTSSQVQTVKRIENKSKVIHVLVALCDNENQGIVPVPAQLGNGEDTVKNLYWGAAFGVKTYFSKSKEWQKVGAISKPKENVLERVIFKHKTENAFLVADAYRGSKMKETIGDFFSAVSGEKLENIDVENQTIQISGNADLVAFIGHNGLMDFEFTEEIKKFDDKKRDAVILACASRNYFSPHLKKTNASPLLWTSNLMAPEAYILHDALTGWLRGETPAQVQTRAASAYAKFQRINLRAAQNLLVTGWK